MSVFDNGYQFGDITKWLSTPTDVGGSGFGDAWDAFLNGGTNQLNKQIAEQNLTFQRENLDYQKALQQEIFNREDTSYQRTVEDMRKAGLNPLAMNGTDSAGEAIATEPLHNDMQYQSMGLAQGLEKILSISNSLQNWEIGNAKVSQETAKAVKDWTDVGFDIGTLDDKYKMSNLDMLNKKFNTDDAFRKSMFGRENYWFTGMPESAFQSIMTGRLLNWGKDFDMYGITYNGKNYGEGYYGKGKWGDIENVMYGGYGAQQIKEFADGLIDSLMSMKDLFKPKFDPKKMKK